MAAKRRRRRRKNAPAAKRRVVRRRRKNPGRFAKLAFNAPRRRRRRRNPVVAHRVRRSFRRNPPGGLVGQIRDGVIDGGAVVAGQVAARKLATGVSAMLPPPLNATVQKVQYVGMRLAAAVGISFAARKFLPKYARMVTAGAFAEAINAALAQTPIAPFLAAIPRRSSVQLNPSNRSLMAAWPARRMISPAGVSAWPARQGRPGLPVSQGT